MSAPIRWLWFAVTLAIAVTLTRRIFDETSKARGVPAQL